MEDFFERFWSCYPRKVGKGNARKSWEKLTPEEPLFNQIILAIDAQVRHRHKMEEHNKTVRNERFRKFLPDWPHPATWLNQQRWLDEIPSIVEAKVELVEERQQCPQCKNMEYFHVQNKKRLCSWHFSLEAEEIRKSLNLPQGPCNINLLRKTFIRHGYKRLPNEGHDEHIKRLRLITRVKARTVGKIPNVVSKPVPGIEDEVQRDIES